MNDLISIIINVYNGEKFIKKCLDCVVNQTYKNLEIVIVNDGSTDNTLSICKSYRDKRIKIINQKNMGLALSRNVGISNSKGAYLYFIDVDDLIELDTIEYLYNLCIKYGADFSTCRSFDVRNNNFNIKNADEVISVISSRDMLKMIFFAEDNAVASWNKLIKKDLYDGIRFENRFSDDILVTHKLVMRTDKIVYSNQYKYYYLKHSESICASKRENYSWNVDMYKAFLERYEYVNKVYSDFIENDVGVLLIIEKLYLLKNRKIIEFLNKENSIKLYKKLFSLSLLRCRMNEREKIKLVIFRISPKFHNFVIDSYLKIVGKSK